MNLSNISCLSLLPVSLMKIEFIVTENEILRGNELLTSIKGHNSVINLRKLMCLDLVNINAYAKSGQIPSICICSQDIERKRNSDTNQGP